MAGHRPWKDIRGDADQDPERRRRVEAARREAEEECQSGRSESNMARNPRPETYSMP